MEQLTMAGLEVDGHAPVANACSGIVVGEVLTVAPHPDADKLRVCQVTDGTEVLQVVCGAPNVTAGMKAPFARIGAEIHESQGGKPLLIRKAKLRGVESNGMLCSTAELGLEDSADGLMALPADAPVGADIRHYLQLDDTRIELGLTPNRGDCLGILGLAREVGVLTRSDVCMPEITAINAVCDTSFPVKITARSECPRYLGRVVRGINTGAHTPLWMQEKLRRCGVRSIDPVVDVTNFVLLEMGQPLHAFDFGRLQGHIEVRLARVGEKLTLLDGKEISLNPDTLVIADAEQAVAMAGIMGGLATAVSAATTDVFLECAFFSPLAVAGRARSYGMHTDASHRYERGVDYQLQARAMERATQLLLDIVGGEPGPVIEALGDLPEPRRIRLRYAAITRLLGMKIPAAEVIDILTRLGLTLVEQDQDSLLLEAPSFRFDLELEVDLIEELARVYGYDRLPKGGGLQPQVLKSTPESRLSAGRIREHLVSLGYQEVITYSFIDPKLCATVLGEQPAPVKLANPISSDMSVMRPSLMPGLLATLKYNDNRQQDRLRIFETGQVFLPDGDSLLQPMHVAGLLSGSRFPPVWANGRDNLDFFDVKGDVESLLALTGQGIELDFSPTNHPALHPGQCARVKKQGMDIGVLGALHPALQRQLEISLPVFLFELQLDSLLQGRLPIAGELSRFPEVARDLAVVVGNETSAAEILAVVRDNAGDYLTGLRIFDVYQGDALGKNKKSIALGLTWQHPSRTLSDDDVNSIIANCVKALEQQFNAKLRN
jgi:phenylalanyl-tRNA synthetase beta chain